MRRSLSRLTLGRRARRAGVFGSIAAVVVPVIVGLAAPAAGLPAPTLSVSVKPSVGKVIEVRPHRVDLMVGGRIQASVDYPAGPLTIASLTVLVARRSWLETSGSTVLLRAGLFQAPQTNVVFAAPAVKRVLLLGDASGVGGTIRGTSATVRFQGVSVAGWDGTEDEPALESPQRPYLYYVHGSSVKVTSSTFDHLGRATAGGHGVTLGSETTGSITDATFSHSHTGLSLLNTGAVAVTRSAAQESSADGIFVKAAIPVQLQQVTSQRNAGFGVVIQQTRATRLINVTTAGNSDGGIRLLGASQTMLSGVSSGTEALGLLVDAGSSLITVVSANAVGDDRAVVISSAARQISLAGVTAQGSRLIGLDLAGTNVRVSAATITGGPTGVSLTHPSTDVRVSQSTITGVGTGVEARAVTHRVALSSLSISRVHDNGVLVSSNGITMRGLRIDSAAVGVRIYGAVDRATLTNSTISNSATGVQVSHTVRGVSLGDVNISGGSTGVSSTSHELQMSGGSIANTSIAMRLAGAASVAGTRMSEVNEGLRVGTASAINVSGVHLSATGVGLRVAVGGHLSIDDSVIGARTLALGDVTFGRNNSLPAEKLRWYGLAAVVAAVSACLLELLRRFREKPEDGTWLLPAGVFNTR